MSAFPAMSPDQLPDLSLVTSMSGLAYMQAVARGEIAGAPIAGTLNFTIDLVEDGRVVFSGTSVCWPSISSRWLGSRSRCRHSSRCTRRRSSVCLA